MLTYVILLCYPINGLLLKPETPTKEVAMAALDKASSPKCPTTITDTTCKLNCNKFTATIGPAIHHCLFTSSHITPPINW